MKCGKKNLKTQLPNSNDISSFLGEKYLHTEAPLCFFLTKAAKTRKEHQQWEEVSQQPGLRHDERKIDVGDRILGKMGLFCFCFFMF